MNRFTAALEFSPAHPALPGHFPGQPILPAVVLLDEVLRQVESIPQASERGASNSCWNIGSAKFHRPARAGEPLTLEVEPCGDGSLRFSISCCGELIAQGLLRRAPAGVPNA